MRRLIPLLMLLALLASCAGPGDTPDDGTPLPGPVGPTAQSSNSDGATISFAAWEGERSLYEPLIKKFNEENPNIKVVLVPLDDILSGGSEQDTPTSALRRLVSSADTAPAFFVPPEAYNSGLLMDMTPLMEADATFKRDDFYPGSLELYTVKGSTRVLPRYLNVQLLSYNKDLFKLENLPTPKPDWSWNDLLSLAEQIAKKNGSIVDTYGFADQSSGVLPLLGLLEAQGIDLLNTPARDLQLTRSEIVTAIKRIRDLSARGALFQPNTPVGKDQPPPDMQQLIRDGKIAIWPSDSVSEPVISDGGQQQTEELPFTVGSLPYPASNLNIFFSGSDGYIISAGSEHPNESWKWIEFLSRQQTDQPGVDGPPGRIPARQSVAEQLNYWKNIDADKADAYRWVIAHPATQLERTPDYIGLSALSEALGHILSENAEPEKALADAQQQLEEQVAQVQLTPSPTPDNSPVLVATPEPQQAPEGATTINFAVPGYSASDVRRLIRSFQQQHPDIFVKIVSTDTFTGPLELKDVAQLSDCFTWYTIPQSDADFSALLDLQPLLESDASFPQNDYPAALLSPYRRGGSLMGLPYSFNIRTLNFNRGAFDATGLKPPSDAWKPADFLSAAQSLTTGEGDKKRYGYVPLGGAQQDMFFFISQFGGQLTRGSGADLRPNFDDPKVIEAIQWFIDLAKVHKVMPEFRFPYKRDDPGIEDHSYEYVQNGRAGMWFDQGLGQFGGGRSDDGNSGAQQLDVGIAALPIGGTGLHSSDFYMRGFHISAKTQQSQACWELLKFMSADLTNLQGSIPARTSIAKSQEFATLAQPGMLDIYNAYADALKRESQVGDDPNAVYSQNIDLYWFYKAIGDAIEGTTSLDKGMPEAQRLTIAYAECMVKKDSDPASCATQVDPSYQGYSTDRPKG